MNQTTLKNSKYEVLTPDGWSDFDGLLITENRDIYKLDNYELECTDNHKILIDNNFVSADKLSKSYIANNKVYDLLNVKKDNQYYTNNIVSHNCAYIDETAFIPNDMQFYESTYPTISSGKESRIIMSTTPNGNRGMFYKLWKDSENGSNSFVNIKIPWWKVPGRDEEWKQETIANTSKEQFRQEFLCEFRGAQNSLVTGDTIDQIVTREPIEEHDSGLKVYSKPKDNHNYVVICDSSEGIGKDYHAVTVIDITYEPYEVVCIYHNNELPPLALSSVLHNIASTYNDAYVLIENNSTGGEIGRNLYYDVEYENVLMTMSDKGKQVIGFSGEARVGVKMTTNVKRLGCSILKTFIEKNKLILNDQYIVFELGNFVANKSGSYAALEGSTDDLVMTLVSFAWLTTQDFFKELADIDVINSITKSEDEDDVMPFGIIDNGLSEFDGENERNYSDMGVFTY